MDDNMMNELKEYLKNLKGRFGYAVEFPQNLPWINTLDPLTLEKVKGHVILLDFWTYCCINCIHVLEDLKYLEEKFKDDPFIVIGVHSAKFKNEQDLDNIRSAVARYEISHPVVVDNELKLWKAYGVRAWPTFVLIGTDGKVIGNISGEGKREVLENSITDVLEKGRKNGTIAKNKIAILPDLILKSYLKFPGKIDLDSQNHVLFISDSNHNRILEVKLEENNVGTVKTIIGNGESGLKDGSFEQAKFNKPQGIVHDNGIIYIADTENHAIRLIDLEKKIVKTIAGAGKQGYHREYKGDPLKISLNSPWDLTLFDHDLYIAMAGSHQIWKLDLKENIIENFAGSGREDIIDGPLKSAALAQPSGIVADKVKNRIYFADSEVSALRYIDLKTLEVKTLIGKGLFMFGMKSGSFDEALLQHPLGIDVKDDKVYLADTYNHAIRIADVNTKTIMNLIYRPRKGVCKIGDKDCDVLPLYEPNDVLVSNNTLYIADTNNHLIRIFDLTSENLEDLYLID